MKVIIKGQIIETAFILSIDKTVYIDQSCGKFFTDAELNIKTVFGNGISIKSKYNSFAHETIDLANETVIKINEEFDKIIKFLDEHSDKPNWPYPILE